MNKQKLLLTYFHNAQAAFLLEEDRLVQVRLHTAGSCNIGDIYVGKVKNIVSGMEAAFVEYAKGKIGFLPLDGLRTRNILNRTNAEKLKCGDEVLVQISKEPLKTKEASLTTDICFTGKNMILIPFSHGIHYSRKFSQEQRRYMYDVMTQVVQSLFGDVTFFLKQYGVIVRTNALYMDAEALAQELHGLFHSAGQVLSVADKRTVFSCLYTEESFFKKAVRDLPAAKDWEIITDVPEIMDELKKYDTGTLRFYEDPMLPMLRLFGIQGQIEEALQKKVWLRSGGYLVIEPTEALTVIDVNSGKMAPGRQKHDSAKLCLDTNIEAATEIARQLRLRNISGMILIDFINMKSGADEETLICHLKEELKKDPVQAVFHDMTMLGLVELTRKKTEAPLFEKWKQLQEGKDVRGDEA